MEKVYDTLTLSEKAELLLEMLEDNGFLCVDSNDGQYYLDINTEVFLSYVEDFLKSLGIS